MICWLHSGRPVPPVRPSGSSWEELATTAPDLTAAGVLARRFGTEKNRLQQIAVARNFALAQIFVAKRAVFSYHPL
jgi:hypothetical protein